ncbi:MAG TPA: FecR domain-containing protein, partial [Opitutus sp.]|nr:FecR domain-containing protein [Opitutus sp.]
MKASLRIVLLVVLTLGASSWLEAALSRQNNVLGRFTVVSVTGTATCVSDGRILELKKGDTIRARGATLETAPGSKVSILFSNQTSTVLDEKTRFEIVKFDQEFFAPNNNLRVEPSNSSTIIKLATGRVVLSTPRLLSGTTMVYETAHAMVGIRGERVLIEAEEKQTHVAMINGTATVNPRAADGSFVSIGKRLTTGQEAFVKYTIGGAAITEEEFVASKENAAAKSAADVPATASIAPGAALPIPTAVATGELTRETEAIVLRLTGPATVKLPNNNVSRAIAEGESVPAGAVLSTNDSAELYLQTFEGTIATLRPKTTVRIEKLSVVTEGGVVKKQSTLLGLQAGTLVSTIDPAKSGLNDYGVRTP